MKSRELLPKEKHKILQKSSGIFTSLVVHEPQVKNFYSKKKKKKEFLLQQNREYSTYEYTYTYTYTIHSFDKWLNTVYVQGELIAA